MNPVDRAAFQTIAGHLAQGRLTADDLIARAETEISVAVKTELANMVKRGLVTRRGGLYRLTAEGKQFAKGMDAGAPPARRLVPDGPVGLQSQTWTALRHFRAATPTQLLESFTSAIKKVTFGARRERMIEYLETLAKMGIVAIDRRKTKASQDFIVRLVKDLGSRHPYANRARFFDPNAGTVVVLDPAKLQGRAHRKAREAAR